jgi:hypothetical protein
MTSEWLGLARLDWVYVEADDWAILHAPGEIANADTDDWFGDGPTACGLAGPTTIPGILSRMGKPRCDRCCDLTRMPRGMGSPKNDDACRPLIGLQP